MKELWVLKRVFTGLAVAASVLACGQSQYPKEELHRTRQLKSYDLHYEPVMEFKEGELKTYTITSNLPKDIKGNLSVKGLPESAKFAGESWQILWQPPRNAGLNLDDPKTGYVRHNIVLTLKSDDPALEIERRAVVIVRRP